MEKNKTSLPRLAAIHDLSGLGKCSLTVALPIVSASGVECCCIPTALLSTHTGGFTGWTFRDLSDDIVPIAEHWSSLDMHFDAIYSGYLASRSQGELLEKTIKLLRSDDTLVVVDPAMADNGHYYSNLDESMTECFKKLIAQADVITPNITEACFLTGTEYRKAPHTMEFIDGLLEKLSRLGPRVVAITGVSPEAGRVGVAARDNTSGKTAYYTSEARDGTFHGSGDVFASSLAALITRGVEIFEAIAVAESFVSACIEHTARSGGGEHYGLDFEVILPEYIKSLDMLL